jgi:hypothetical protein
MIYLARLRDRLRVVVKCAEVMEDEGREQNVEKKWSLLYREESLRVALGEMRQL